VRKKGKEKKRVRREGEEKKGEISNVASLQKNETRKRDLMKQTPPTFQFNVIVPKDLTQKERQSIRVSLTPPK
jgi:hypothetical protein